MSPATYTRKKSKSSGGIPIFLGCNHLAAGCKSRKISQELVSLDCEPVRQAIQ